MRRAWLLLLLMVLTAAGEPRLPLGAADLPETRETVTLGPGVTLTTIRRGSPDPEGRVWYQYDPQPEGRPGAVHVPMDTPAPDRPGPRVPRVASRVEEEAPGTRRVHTTEDGGPTTGPWFVQVLDVDLKEAAVQPVLGQGRQPVSSHRALAAVNGGYFVEDYEPGEPAGVYVQDGALVSEALDGRGALILEPGKARIAAVATEAVAIASDGAKREITGSNRLPGMARSYAKEPGPPYAAHDTTARLPDDLVLFTRGTTPAGEGVEALLDARGTVTSLSRTRGRPVPPGHAVLAGIGASAYWLRDHARVGRRLQIVLHATANGHPLPLHPGLDLVNGGPILLRDGQLVQRGWAEGFDRPDDPSFYHRFAVRRHPRTLAGVTASGHLLLVTLDGRQPDHSVGASFDEAARVMQSLGCVDALNLDGGGSTAMAVRGRLVTRPSDAQGERAVGDALLVCP